MTSTKLNAAIRVSARLAAAAVIGASALMGPAAAQTVTLAEAYSLMLDNEVQYEILDLEQTVSEELVRQARGERLPRVGLNIEYIQTQQEIVSQDNDTFQEGSSEYPTTRVTFSVRQPLYDPVRWRSLPLARAEAELVTAQAAVAEMDLASRLTGAYLDVARAQIAMEQARILIRARTQLERNLSLQVEAGRIDADALLRAQSDTFEARATEAERELELTSALFDLYRYTGPGIEAVAFGGADVGIAGYNQFLSTFSADRLRDLSPAIQVAQAEIAVAERSLERVRGAFQPTANVTLESQLEQTEGSLFGGGSEVQSTELGLNLEWSIYEGGVRRSQVREAEARVEIANLRLQQVTTLANARYEALTASLQAAQATVSAIASEQGAAQRRLAAAVEQEDAGVTEAGAALEARLRRDTLSLQGQIARLRVIQIQTDILALFGALDIDTLSQDFRGA